MNICWFTDCPACRLLPSTGQNAQKQVEGTPSCATHQGPSGKSGRHRRLRLREKTRGQTAGQNCTRRVTDTPGLDPGARVSVYPASERDSAHPGLGVLWGQGWCRETRSVTHRYGIGPREAPRRRDTHSWLVLWLEEPVTKNRWRNWRGCWEVDRESQTGDPDPGLGCHTCVPVPLTPAIPDDRALHLCPQPQGLAGSLKACFVFHSHFERAVTALPVTADLSLTLSPLPPPSTSPALTSCLQGLGKGEISWALHAAPAWGLTGRAGQAASLERAHDSPGGQGPGWHPGGNATSPG